MADPIGLLAVRINGTLEYGTPLHRAPPGWTSTRERFLVWSVQRADHPCKCCYGAGNMRSPPTWRLLRCGSGSHFEAERKFETSVTLRTRYVDHLAPSDIETHVVDRRGSVTEENEVSGRYQGATRNGWSGVELILSHPGKPDPGMFIRCPGEP